MAVVDTLSIPIIDDAGRSSRVLVHGASGYTVAQWQAYSNAFVTELDAVVGGVISGPEITLTLSLPGGLKVSPVADHLNSRGALCNYDPALTNYTWSQYLPSFLHSLIDGGTPNVLHADFTAYRDMIVVGDGTVVPTDKYANDISGFVGATLKSRKR